MCVCDCSENDNAPEFARHEVEVQFDEKIVNGYQIPFEGARDADEGNNSVIHYLLDCSNDHSMDGIHDKLNQSSSKCSPLFHLSLLSQSSTSNYDRLALKFLPPPTSSSSSVEVKNEYRLTLYARDNDDDEHISSMTIHVKIKQEKEKPPQFSLSTYEFVVVLNSSSLQVDNDDDDDADEDDGRMVIGRVYAIPHHSFQRITYHLIRRTNQTHHLIEINSFTGELSWMRKKKKKKKKKHDNYSSHHHFFDQMEFDVQASTFSSSSSSSSSLSPSSSKVTSSKVLLTCRSRVKIYFRHLDQIKNISFHFHINPSKDNQSRIVQMSNSRSFLVNRDVAMNEELFDVSVDSSSYPSDRYILSLDNYLTLFSLTSSSSSMNRYVLRTRQHLPSSTSFYVLNIGVKHKLSQQWLSTVKIELITVDQFTTTTTTITTTSRTTTTTTTTTAAAEEQTMMMMMMSSTIHPGDVVISSDDEGVVKLTNRSSSSSFCVEDQTYLLYQIETQRKSKKNNKKKKKKQEIGVLKVIEEGNVDEKKTKNMMMYVNGSEVMVDGGCRMSLDQLKNANISLNQSMDYQLCSSISVNECYDVRIEDQLNSTPSKKTTASDVMVGFVSMRWVEVVMFVMSMVFVFVTLILLVLFCRMRDVDVCVKVRDYLFDRSLCGMSGDGEQQFSSRVHSIVLHQSPSSSFQSIRISK